MRALEYSKEAITVSSARFKKRIIGATHTGLQTIPVRSRPLDFDSPILLILAKGPVCKYIHLMHTTGLAMGGLQYTTSLDLIVRPVSEQTLGVTIPFWVLTKSAWWKRVDFAGISVEIHPWPRR